MSGADKRRKNGGDKPGRGISADCSSDDGGKPAEEEGKPVEEKLLQNEEESTSKGHDEDTSCKLGVDKSGGVTLGDGKLDYSTDASLVAASLEGSKSGGGVGSTCLSCSSEVAVQTEVVSCFSAEEIGLLLQKVGERERISDKKNEEMIVKYQKLVQEMATTNTTQQKIIQQLQQQLESVTAERNLLADEKLGCDFAEEELGAEVVGSLGVG